VRTPDNKPGLCAKAAHGFTLIELLIVVAIIAVLAVIAVFNMAEATERAYRASNASNLRTIMTALQTYHVDYGRMPPGDREAGPFESHTEAFVAVGNGPAAGGSWDGLPWLLLTHGYLSNPEVMFNPRYRRQFQGGTTLRGSWPRYHNFRYAYNSSALSTGGNLGGAGNIDTGEVWLVRDLWLDPREGFYAASYPRYPADYRYPWKGTAPDSRGLEHVIFADGAVRLVEGGTNREAR
jgi:prepilin-type N-terminal cleavage/methylation domain-containing protein